MKKTIFLALLCLTFAAHGQVKSAAADSTSQVISTFGSIPSERKFALIEIFDNDAYLDSFKVKKLITDVILIDHDGQITKRDTESDTATLYLPADGVTKYIGTTTWHTNTLFDTTWTETARIDDSGGSKTPWQTLTNVWSVTGTTKPGVYNKSFSSVSVTSSPSVQEIKPVICDRLEFFGERFNGHGNVKIFVDGPDGAWIQVYTATQGNQPWVTDFSRMAPSFSYVWPKANWNDPPKLHKMKWETDPGNQYIIDFVRVVKMTLTPRGGPIATPKR